MASKKPIVVTNGQDEVLQSSDILAIGCIATGTPNGTKFVRDDGTLQVPGGSGDMIAANNLSDVVSASASRSNLGLVIGTDVLAPNGSGALLTSIPTSAITNYRGYTLTLQALTSAPVDAQTIYFGTIPAAPSTTQGTRKVRIPRTGTIKSCVIYSQSGTAGTSESWTLSIRVNNTADNTIAGVGVATNEREWINNSMSVAVSAGDYIEIKSVNPTWATNPNTTIFGGFIYIE